MKKKVFLALALIALIATGAVFAQQATMDKLTFTPSPNRNNPTLYYVTAVNKWISGQVVIPGAYEGKPMRVAGDGFRDCTNITSVVILDGVTQFDGNAFR